MELPKQVREHIREIVRGMCGAGYYHVWETDGGYQRRITKQRPCSECSWYRNTCDADRIIELVETTYDTPTLKGMSYLDALTEL